MFCGAIQRVSRAFRRRESAFASETLQINQTNTKSLAPRRRLSHAISALETTTSTHKSFNHIPVMSEEVVTYLKSSKPQTILDCTFGAGGHSRKLLIACEQCRIIALDRDPASRSFAQQLNHEFPGRLTLLEGKFSDLPTLLKQHALGRNSFDAMLFDFGASSMQFDDAARGFSLSQDGPLDMRMTPEIGTPSAADVLATASEEDLYKILKYYGEEKQARKIARSVVEARYLFKKLARTHELADLVHAVYARDAEYNCLQQKTSHVATKTFQALRIFVNNELNEINYGMILAARLLKIGGRLVTITFHSLEDTIVKRHMSGNLIANAANALPLRFVSHLNDIDNQLIQQAMESDWKMLHKHVLVPSFDEVEANPRSRSAKMRAMIRIR